MCQAPDNPHQPGDGHCRAESTDSSAIIANYRQAESMHNQYMIIKYEIYLRGRIKEARDRRCAQEIRLAELTRRRQAQDEQIAELQNQKAELDEKLKGSLQRIEFLKAELRKARNEAVADPRAAAARPPSPQP